MWTTSESLYLCVLQILLERIKSQAEINNTDKTNSSIIPIELQICVPERKFQTLKYILIP